MNAFNDMIGYVNELSEKHDLRRVLRTSENYASIDESLAYMDYHETMEYLKKTQHQTFSTI